MADQIEHFESGATNTGREKLDTMIDAINEHSTAIEALQKYSPYIITLCVDNEAALFEILARKTGEGEEQAPP